MKWKIQPPRAETAEPLAIAFPEPMDHALAQRVIRVTAGSGEGVDGTITMVEQERVWNFIPAQTWRHGSYALIVQTTIEDLAGNNIGKPFEVDVVEAVQPRLTSQFVKLPFDVR
jgi:hypothetical protein